MRSIKNLSWGMLCALAGVGCAIIGTPRASGADEVKSEPYIWRHAVIKANGFPNGIVFSRAQGGTVYIHTDMGGAYRLDGDQWVCITDWIKHDDWSLNQMGAETLAADPTDPNRVYVGLGTYMGPSAVMRSTDQGRTWERTNVPFGMNGNGSARQSGQRMNVDPNLPARLIYGTRDKGLWKSEDHGATWSQVESFPTIGDEEGPTRDTGITWTLFDATSGAKDQASRTIYAGVATVKEGKVFRSLDAGKTWEAIPGQPGGAVLPDAVPAPDGRLPGGHLLANRAVLAPDGRTLYVTYVVTERYPGPHGITGGAVYKVVDPQADNPQWKDITPEKGKWGWSGISMDPTDPNTIYVTTLCRYGDPGDDIWRSRDGGETWKPLNIKAHRDDSSAPYVVDFGIHWTGDVQVDPHNREVGYFTTGWGLYRTTNLTADEPTWAFYNEGFEQSAVTELVSPTGGAAHLISAIADRDGYRHEDLTVTPPHGRLGQPNDKGQTEKLTVGTNNDLDVAWNAPEIVVRVGGAPQYSNDGGFTWHRFAAPTTPAGQGQAGQQEGGGGGGPRDGSITLSPDGQTVVWAPRRGIPLFATRQGDGWSAWTESTGMPAPTGPGSGWGGNVTMVVADLVNPKTFYARTSDALYVSTNGGRTWSQQAGNLPAQPRWLRAVPGHAGHLWLTAGDEGQNGLNYSTDGGKTWTRVAPELVRVAKQVGVGAPAQEGGYPAVFIGGTIGEARGFFRSDDAGKTWVRINDDEHQYGNVVVIQGDSRVHGRLFVGTNGRGIPYGEPVKRTAEE